MELPNQLNSVTYRAKLFSKEGELYSLVVFMWSNLIKCKFLIHIRIRRFMRYVT